MNRAADSSFFTYRVHVTLFWTTEKYVIFIKQSSKLENLQKATTQNKVCLFFKSHIMKLILKFGKGDLHFGLLDYYLHHFHFHTLSNSILLSSLWSNNFLALLWQTNQPLFILPSRLLFVWPESSSFPPKPVQETLIHVSTYFIFTTANVWLSGEWGGGASWFLPLLGLRSAN